MKHHLSSIRRSPWLRVACLLILTLLCAPAAMAAASAAPVVLPAASGSHLGSAFLAAGLGGMIMLRNAASDDGSDNGGGEAPVDPAAAIAAIEDKTLPMSQRLGVALKALQGIAPAEQFTKVKTDLATANSTLQAKDTEIAGLKTKLKTAEDQLAAAQGDVTTLEQSNAKLEKDLADLQSKETDLEKRADVKAKEKLATLGFPASRLPGPDAQTKDKSDEDAIRALTGSQRTQAALYYKQHGKLPAWMNN